MTDAKSRRGLAIKAATLAGMVALAACGGPSPVVRTSTTEQTTTTTPRPVVSTTTTRTEHIDQQ
jgi:hypothetical protein